MNKMERNVFDAKDKKRQFFYYVNKWKNVFLLVARDKIIANIVFYILCTCMTIRV
jgi:hypothetical protein